MWKAVKFLAALSLGCSVMTGLALAGSDIPVSQDPNPSQVENEPSITINSHFSGPDLLNVVACYNDIGNALGASWSADSGKTWTDVQLPYVWTWTGDPCVWSDNNGVVHAIFLSYQGPTFYGNSGIYYSQSIDGGRNWSSAYPVDNQVFVSTPVPFADKCMMAVDTFFTSPNVGNIYVGWQREPPNTTNSDIFFSRSNDGGVSFSTPIQVNDNPTGTSFCEGAMPFVGADGDVYMTWYDSYFQGHTPGSLWVDKSLDGGLTWGTDVKVANFLAPPKYTGAHANFKAKVFPSAATDPHDSERLYITYINDPDGYFDRRLNTGTPNNTTAADRPDICRNGSWVYGVWQDSRNGVGNGDIYFNRSSDNGATWELAAIGPLDNTDVPGNNLSELARVASSGNNVYAVWQDHRGGPTEIFFNYSNNNGTTWKTEVNLSNTPAYMSSNPAIAAVGNYVYVAWNDEVNGAFPSPPTDIFFVFSTDYGVTWSTPARIDLGDAAGSNFSYYPRLTCTGSYVHCAWRDMRTGTTQPFFNHSNNNGVTWQATSTNLASGAGWTEFAYRGGLECTGSYVYACWTNNQSGFFETYFNVSTNSGATWTGPVMIMDLPGGLVPTSPSMAISGNYVYIGWTDQRNSGGGGPTDFYFDYSPDNGVTWQTDIGPLDIGGIGTSVYWPYVRADGNYVYAMWLDDRIAPGAGGQILINRSSNNGQTWAGETLVSYGYFPQQGVSTGLIPTMAAGNNWVNVVWPDQRYVGIPDIYTNYSSNNGATWLTGPDEADVLCVRSTDGGATWSAPVTVNDDGTVSAQVLPWVAVKSNGYVDLTYYHYSPLLWGEGAQVRLAVSTDGGVTFGPSQAIQDLQVPPGTQWVGEYNGMAVLDDMVYTIFTDLAQTGSSDVWLDRTFNPSAPDSDGDGWPDASDNCPTLYNPSQADLDGDLIGDVCDPDADGDGVDGFAAGGLDCDDLNSLIYPGATEIWYDGVDQDCDGWSDYDQDQDGVDSDSYGGADCDDTDYGINPGATEIWYDGIDQDCDGWSDYDQDQDGVDSDSYGGADCDDTNPAVWPGASEVCNGYDDDCDGTSDAEFGDGDADGWGDACDNCWTVANPVQADSDGDCPIGPYGSDPDCGDACQGGGCCVGRVGDANGLGGDEPTIGDVSVMIDAKFITGTCVGILNCLTEADVNQSGGSSPTCGDITIGDISTLIDYLFITGPTLGLPICL